MQRLMRLSGRYERYRQRRKNNKTAAISITRPFLICASIISFRLPVHRAFRALPQRLLD